MISLAIISPMLTERTEYALRTLTCFRNTDREAPERSQKEIVSQLRLFKRRI